ncbi:MAG: ribosomal protein S18-alanine N-acetyltransferase [Bacillota bacterium]
MAAEAGNDRQPVHGIKPTFSVMLPEHLDQVLNIETRSFPTPWSLRAFQFEVTENDFAVYIVAQIEGKVVGYAGMWIVLDEAHITNVAVHPEYRGTGYGRALMVELVGRAAVMGAVKITLEVRVSNIAARNLYRSMGFVERGIRKKYYSDNNEDAIIMWLDLRRAGF